MASRQSDTWEYLQPFADASAAWIEVRAFPVGARDLAVFFRDVSERKQAEQSLMDADRRKDEFLAMLAHELRNPLAPIGAAAHLLQMGNQDVERVRSTSQIIARQVAHMTHLIDDLLDVSRVTRGLVELEREPLDVRRVVAEAVEQVGPLIEARRHQLALHMPTEAITVPGDRKRLVQVLANILNNAAKYTGEGGAIDLHVSPRSGHVLFEVSDNGIGMTRDLAAHAFDLFAQAERSADRSGGGLGLGLALVKNLVELHGGTVSCRSAGLGQGSTFCVCLPRIDAAVAARDDAMRGPIGAAATPRRVMIVDDNADAGHMLAMLLEAVGHEVTVADSAHAALALAAAAPAQVYLIDIGLPGMDGNELARQLRARPENRGATLIAVTGYGQDSDRSRSFAAGFHHHLVKPVDLQALTDLLARPAPAR
jgi:signal transduction histidine kinase